MRKMDTRDGRPERVDDDGYVSTFLPAAGNVLYYILTVSN